MTAVVKLVITYDCKNARAALKPSSLPDIGLTEFFIEYHLLNKQITTTIIGNIKNAYKNFVLNINYKFLFQ